MSSYNYNNNNDNGDGYDFLPGSASLCEHLDQKILVILRDGRHLIGTLCTVDQYSNLVLDNTVERHFCIPKKIYADDTLGTFLVRGDNIVILGDVDENKEEASGLKGVSLQEVMEARAEIEEEGKEESEDDDDDNDNVIKSKSNDIWRFDF